MRGSVVSTSTSGRQGKASHPRTLAVAPVTGAIRAALAISFTLLAIGGSGVADAQSCAFAAPATETCEGVFTGTLPDPALFTPVADLTLVLGDGADSMPTSVTPATGLMGIDANWGGDVGVTSYADISTQGATGIFAYSSAAATVNNQGSITTDAAAGGAGAMDISAYGDVSVINDGPVDAYGTGVHDLTAVSAYSVHGQVSVDNQAAGTITAAAQDGTAMALYASAYGDSTVGNEGTITAYSANGAATGVIAYAYQGDASIGNNGGISATSGSGQAVALIATASHGDATVDNAGTVSATGGQDQTVGIESYGAAGSYVTNSGSVTAVSGSGSAIGIQAQSAYDGYATVQNSGNIQVGGYARAVGIDAYGGDGSVVENSGHVGATADSAGAIDASAYGVSDRSIYDAYVSNGSLGDIVVSADSPDGNGFAVGVYASSGSLGRVYNDGAISASASSDHANARAYAVEEQGFDGTALLINGGDLDAQATVGVGGTADARGAYVHAGTASIFNHASIGAVAISDGGTATALGARVSGSYTAISNYGDLAASASADGGSAEARGADASGYLESRAYNASTGNIQVGATAAGGVAYATGIYSRGRIYGSTTDNQGAIAANASGEYATSFGVYNVSPYVGDAVVTNTGDIGASAQGALQANAYGVYDYAWVYNATVDNSGSIHATAVAEANGDNIQYTNAIGVVAINKIGYYGASIVNSGSIEASASAYYGVPQAFGVAIVSGGTGTLTLDNEATISAYSHVEYAKAMATGAYMSTMGGVLQVVNHGDLSATARAERGVGYLTDYAYSTALVAHSLPYSYNSATFINNYANASIEAEASVEGGIAGATAIDAMGVNVTIVNDAGATISASGHADLFGGGFASAIEASGTYGVDVFNYGTISAYGHARSYAVGPHTYYGIGTATGIYANASQQGNVSVVNHGDIEARAISEHGTNWAAGGAGATGVHIYAKYDAVVDNTGSISAVASSEFGNVSTYGASVRGKYYSHLINEAGASIEALSSVGSLSGDVYGGRVVSFGTEMFGATYATTYNAGSIVSHATSTPPAGAPSNVPGMATAYGSVVGSVNWSAIDHGSIVNLGDIEAVAQADGGYATSYGTMLVAQVDAKLSNSGSILARGQADDGSAFVVGSVSSSVHTYYSVPCTYANGYRQCDYSHATHVVDGGSTTVDNTGSIAASGRARGGDAEVYGVVGIAGLDVGVTNAGDIGASVDADDAMAVAVLANSYIGQAAVQNDRSIHAHATGGTASATGVSMLATLGDADNGDLEATLVNHGDIVATAQGDTATTAIGATLTGRDAGDVQVVNGGKIAASAEGGQATATAVSADSVGSIVLGNTGDIVASANGDNAVATGIAAVSHAGDGVQVDNGKAISAAAYGAQGTATALSLDAYGSVALTNGGTITAMSEGDGAVGVAAVSRHGGALSIDNTGSIVATAKGEQAGAIAVSMDSTAGAMLDNKGVIAAYGNGVAIASGKDTSATIVNHGAITGAITGGDLDDGFENMAGATWHATGSSDFGAGDDHIVNHGTLYMEDAQIVLGGYTVGNTFENAGTLIVKGAGNVIDMDNPFPIENNGLIDLANGVAGDALTLKGDLNGKGSIAVDASALNGSMDRLDIQGHVSDTARQTIDVNLLDAPHAASVAIPFLQANGDPGKAFTLGNVRYAGGGFVSLDFSLRSGADPTDVTRKLLSLEVDATGLNAAGSLAAALAPGVQSLVDAQVGTWRERAGVVPRADGSRLAPWVRTFASSGGVDPGHSGSLGGGSLDFQQANQGLELGLDARVSEHLSAGVLVATAQGRQHLDGVSGNDRFDDRAFGAYATWLADQGFYLDVSQRWNNIDAKLSAGAQGYSADASASTFNVETGFTAWKLGRIGIGPQLQYTRTRVDGIDLLRDGTATFDEKGGTSSQGRLGVALDGHFRGLGFDWTPYGSVNMVREFSSRYGYAVNDGILGAVDTRGTSALVEAGLGARKGGFSVTAGVHWSDGGVLRSVTGGQLTMRYDW